MAVLDIVLAPDPRLKHKCAPVGEVTDAVRTLLDDMLETMYAANGIGLAAPQIAGTQRVIVMDVSKNEDEKKPLKLINPEVIWASDDTNTYEEGCLSIPDHYGDVTRPERVKIRYLDTHGDTQEMDADGLLATCVQHEIDHLDGVLFVDYLSPLKRNIILKKMQKLKKQKARDAA